MIKKIFAYILIMCIALLMFAGYAGTAEEKIRIAMDCLEEKAEFSENIKRLIYVNQSFCVFMTAIGIQDKLIGMCNQVFGHSWVSIFCNGYFLMQRYGCEPTAETIHKAEKPFAFMKIDLCVLELSSA